MLLVRKNFLMLGITLSELTRGGGGVQSEQSRCRTFRLTCPSRRRGSTRTPGGKPARMQRVYEIFEVMPNGTPQRVTVISGVEFAKLALQGLAKRTKNECFAADAKTRQVVMYVNVPLGKSRATRSIFQICYDEKLAVHRAKLLKSRGYDAISVIGNDAAKAVLSSIQHYDLFIVGQAAPQETRKRDRCLAQSQLPRCQDSCPESAQSTNPGSRLQRPTERARDMVADCLSAIIELRFERRLIRSLMPTPQPSDQLHPLPRT